LSVGQQFRYWGIGFVLLMVVFYFLGSALTPFLIGAGMAYIMDPMADKLQTWGASRIAATGIITFVAFVAFLLVLLILAPFIYDQATSFAQEAPKMLETFFLGTFYAAGLMLIGLEFGAFVGLFAGLISFIPYVGSLVGGALAIGLALFQFWGEWGWIAAVLAVFGLGQFIEGNILTPKLVGSSVGLHPVWLMFALSAFGVMFGFFGLLIAVPAAAMIGVLARFALGEYLGGRLYTGIVGQNPPSDPT